MGVMEKDEMKVEEFEPTLQFTILLYFYFVVLMTLGASSLMHLFSYNFNYFILTPDIPWWAVIWDGAISVFSTLYGIKAITLALRGHRCAVSAMRWSLWMCFFYSFCGFYDRIGPAGMGYVIIVALLPVIYTFFFWIYMLQSKTIKNVYPEGFRKKWFWGTFGKILFWSYLLWFAVLIYRNFEIRNNSKQAPLTQIELRKGEITDGFYKSSPLHTWHVLKKSSSDVIYITEDSCRIHLASMLMDNSDRLTYNEMLGREMMSGGYYASEEISHIDTLLSGKRLYCSKYRIISKSDSLSESFFMSAALFDNKSKKVAILSVIGDTATLISRDELIQYMNSVDFNLK